jgi:hypothetical protein
MLYREIIAVLRFTQNNVALKRKVTQSQYRPGQALRVPGG